MATTTTLLTASQALALNVFKNTNRNLFLFGDAGTGKTFLIQRMKAHCEARNINYATITPTGAAAVLANGCTIASFLVGAPGSNERGWYTSKMDLLNMFNTSEQSRGKRKREDAGLDSATSHDVDTLFIDEISMVDNALFSLLDHRLRADRQRNLPFGGARVIISGDFCQLAPVVNVHDPNAATTGQYAFEAYTVRRPGLPDALHNPWANAQLVPLRLAEQVRANGDENLQRVASAMRSGKSFAQWDADIQRALLSRTFDECPSDALDVTHCFWSNNANAGHNKNRNDMLPGPVVFIAETKRLPVRLNQAGTSVEEQALAVDASRTMWTYIDKLVGDTVDWRAKHELKIGTKV